MRVTIAKFTDEPTEVGIHRSQKTRAKWETYYENGYRLCRVTSPSGTPRLMFLQDKPITTGRVMVLKLAPARFIEVWSDIDHKIGSAWLKTGCKTYYGGKVNGWKLREASVVPGCEFKQASSKAMKSLLLFRMP